MADRLAFSIALVFGATLVFLAALPDPPAGEAAVAPPVEVHAQTQERPPFTHADHETVRCVDCHTSGDRHGQTFVTTLADCRSCHHRSPAPGTCVTCHAASDAPTDAYEVVRSVAFSVGTSDARRALDFPHGEHADLDCARCHTQGNALAAPADLDCQSCHAEHHTPTSACASCHRAPPVSAHPPSEAHVTCSGASCHQRFPFPAVLRTRDFCLGCHQNMTEHETPRACNECHQLPAPRPQPGGGG